MLEMLPTIAIAGVAAALYRIIGLSAVETLLRSSKKRWPNQRRDKLLEPTANEVYDYYFAGLRIAVHGVVSGLIFYMLLLADKRDANNDPVLDAILYVVAIASAALMLAALYKHWRHLLKQRRRRQS